MTAKIKAIKDYLGQEFLITREFDAPRELVFKAWTDPKHLAQWWGPRGFTNPVCEWDLRPARKFMSSCAHPTGTDYPDGRRVPGNHRAGKAGVHERRAG